MRMRTLAGESTGEAQRLNFDLRLIVQFRGRRDHLRCRIAGLSRGGRPARSDHDWWRDVGGCSTGKNGLLVAVGVWTDGPTFLPRKSGGPPLDDLPDVSFTERLTAQKSSMLALRICFGIG